MNSSISLGKALLALQLAAATPLASAAILQNGSFELPVVANGAAVQTTPVGWAWDGSIGFLFSSDAPGFAADGEQFVDIGNTSAFALRQDFSSGADGLYRLSWSDNAAAFAQVAPYRFAVTGVVDHGGQFDANEGVDGLWTAREALLQLAPGNYQLVFAPVDVAMPLPAQDRYIDNVSLAPVPVPAALWLLGPAVVGLLGMSRRAGRADPPT